MASFSRRAVLDWDGDVPRGSGHVSAGSGAFRVEATFPRLAGERAGATTPEELLAAAHATCFGIGVRSVLAARGGTARRVHVTATVTADKADGQIRVRSVEAEAVVDELAGLGPQALQAIADAAETACTISAILRATVPVTVRIRPGLPPNDR